MDQLPWPDVRGKRCLDVGTYDGYLAFELEKRGAAEIAPAPNYQDPRSEQYGFGFMREDWTPQPAYCQFAAQAGNQPSGC